MADEATDGVFGGACPDERDQGKEGEFVAAPWEWREGERARRRRRRPAVARMAWEASRVVAPVTVGRDAREREATATMVAVVRRRGSRLKREEARRHGSTVAPTSPMYVIMSFVEEIPGV